MEHCDLSAHNTAIKRCTKYYDCKVANNNLDSTLKTSDGLYKSQATWNTMALHWIYNVMKRFRRIFFVKVELLFKGLR